MQRALSVSLAAAMFLAASGFDHSVLAQVGDTSGVTYPNWKASDRVAPAVTVNVSYNDTTAKWHYAYTVANGPSAVQDINQFQLRFFSPSVIGAAPQGWDSFVVDTSGAIPGADFATLGEGFVDVTGGTAPAPGPAQIPPGGSLSGFVIVSSYPPGEARTYIRGYAAVPYLPDSMDDPVVTPHDTTNAQRAWSIGPTIYTKIVTYGTKEPTDLGRANQFMAFMNVDTVGTTLRAPAVIAIRFDNGWDGDCVMPETFKAYLNGVDVTSAFHPGPANDRSTPGTIGADLVAVFTLDPGGPLVSGANVLKTMVSGLLSRFIPVPSVVDTDIIKFNLDPSK